MNDKIQSFKLENFGILPNLEFAPSAGINLIIGENGTGKTMLLKALYAATRAALVPPLRYGVTGWGTRATPTAQYKYGNAGGCIERRVSHH